MADTNQFSAIQAGTMSPEDYAQQQALNRQQRFADLLMAQGQQPQGQMVSGRYVPPSFFQMLNPVVNQLAGAYIGKKGEEESLKLAQKIREAKSSKEQAITNLITGSPAIPAIEGGIQGPNGMTTQTTPDMYGSDMSLNPQYKQIAPVAGKAATKPDLSAALREMSINNPYGAGSEYKAALVGNMIPKKTDEMLNFEAAKADGYKGSFTDYKNKMNDYQKEELKISAGRLAVDQAKAAFEMQNGKPLNESQGKAAVFHSQMVGANNELNDVYAKGFNPNKPQSQATTSMAGGIFNFLTPASAQQAKQAQNQWTEAYLRFKTGAGTNAHEIEANRKTYFPDIGDSPAVVAQKARMREQAQNDIAMAAGPQGARMGVQSNPIPSNPIPSNAPVQQITPSLWGPATVVK
jgi:hypothetical protein